MYLTKYGNYLSIIYRDAADCTQAEHLTEGVVANNLLADKGYDVDAILEMAQRASMLAVIPSKKNRKIKREYDKDLYKLRHLVENPSMTLKQWQVIATRCAKNLSSFLAAVHIRCIAVWAKIY